MQTTEVDQPPAEAMALFESAREHYRGGRYAEAASDLERALVLDPGAPAILSSLARVYELEGRYADALETNARLLQATPVSQPADRQRIQETIQRLEGVQRLATPPPAYHAPEDLEAVGPTYVRERGVADDAFFGTFAIGGIAGTTAIVAGLLALTQYQALGNTTLAVTTDEREGVTTYSNYQTRHRGIRLAAVVADVAGGVAIAGLTVATLLYMLREDVYEQWPDGHRTRRRRRIDVSTGETAPEESDVVEEEEEESEPGVPWYQRDARTELELHVSPMGILLAGTF